MRPARSGRSSACSTTSFTLDDVRSAVVELEIVGATDFRLQGQSRMSEISRDPEELVRQAMSEHHYPDGFALFLGTLFAPTEDRDEPGRGFTHKIGDEVRISTPEARHAGEHRHDIARRAAVGVRSARADAQSRRARAAAASESSAMTDTLTHLINGEAFGGDARRARASTRRISTTSSRAIPRAARPKSTRR